MINLYTDLLNGTLTVTTSLSQSGSGSNGNEWAPHFPQVPELEPHHEMQFSVIHRTPFLGRVLSLSQG